MTRTISQEEFAQTAPDLLQAVGEQTVLIEEGGKAVAALISMEQYESTREARGERAIRACIDSVSTWSLSRLPRSWWSWRRRLIERRLSRIILDTNTMISGAIYPRSVPGEAIARALREGLVLRSEATWLELETVIP